ncbi:MAG: orotate phosphoribosyltransferase [Patescibacteria group bacterium]
MKNTVLLNAYAEMGQYFKGPVYRGDGAIVPFTIDSRPLQWRPKLAKVVVKALAKEVKKFKPQAIAGGLTGGALWGVQVAAELKLPFVLVRKEPRGRSIDRGLIEGEIIKNRRVVMVDDSLISGHSANKFVKALKKGKLKIVGYVAMQVMNLSYVKKWSRRHKMPVKYLLTYKEQVDSFYNLGLIDNELQYLLHKFISKPYTWHKNKADYKIFKNRLAKQSVWRTLK